MPHTLKYAFKAAVHVSGWLPLKVDKKGLKLFKHADGRVAKEIKDKAGKVIGYGIYKGLIRISTSTVLP